MTDKTALLEKIASERILILDGAMGTMIQRHGLTEADYRGVQYADWPSDLKGNNDLLSITKPEVIEGIHAAFFEAGADIIETNTFNSTAVSLADYGMSAMAREYNLASARLARKVADAFTAKTPDKPRFVAGAIGPMNKTLSLSPDVNNPGYRDVEFDGVAAAYKEQVEALVDGGVDIILIETIFDTLNAKAAIFATEEVFEERGIKLPIILSCTVTDRSGRNLSGQTIEAFWYSVQHARPFAVGLNCAFGAELLRPYAVALNRVANTRVSIYPNAGLPNELGEYDETPGMTAAQLESWAKEGLFNIVGGCCGTTPGHIEAIANAVKAYAPRTIPTLEPEMRLSGLDPLTIIGQSAA